MTIDEAELGRRERGVRWKGAALSWRMLLNDPFTTPARARLLRDELAKRFDDDDPFVALMDSELETMVKAAESADPDRAG